MFCPKGTRGSAFNELLSFTYPSLRTGKSWHVEFSAFDPAQGKMRRKRIKINRIGNDSMKQRYASQLCHRIATKLESGWNPWVEPENGPTFSTVEEVFAHYRTYIAKLRDDGIYRKSTYEDYSSSLNILENWIARQKSPIRYIYQLDKRFCMRFLDHVYIERGNSPTTRNNYLTFLKSFSTFLVNYQYVQAKPTDGIATFSRRAARKQRTVIPDNDMARLREYLERANPHFLLNMTGQSFRVKETQRPLKI